MKRGNSKENKLLNPLPATTGPTSFPAEHNCFYNVLKLSGKHQGFCSKSCQKAPLYVLLPINEHAYLKFLGIQFD